MSKIDLKSLDRSIGSAREYLFSRQSSDGFWMGKLEADVTVAADYVLLMRILGKRNIQREKRAVNFMLRHQKANGSWSLYWGGEGNLDVTLRAYFSLKMCGIPPGLDHMAKAKKFILENGGIERTNTYTKIMLALFGQCSWEKVPEIPPEIIFLPRWFYINIYDFASWARATIMAFSIIISLKPVFRIEENRNIFDLYTDRKNFNGTGPLRERRTGTLGSMFLMLNRALKVWDRMPGTLKLGRKTAVKRVEKWVLDHQEEDGSWGGIMLPWLFSLIALKYLGYKNSHPVMKKGLAGLEDFVIEDSNEFLLQPATSPIWDTAWAIIALRRSGIPKNDPRLIKSAEWLLGQQVNTEGDWKIRNPRSQPGCWSFEFKNKFYPDIDDTSKVCLALRLVDLPQNGKKEDAIGRGVKWVLDMQNKDGSWAAFDRDNSKRLLASIPFADFIPPLDFGSPDITGHVLYILSELGYCPIIDKKYILRALKYLKSSQKKDGSWYGRWGVNYIYGTSKVLQAFDVLASNGFLNGEYAPQIEDSLDWLRKCQNDDGGWGESCKSYDMGKYCHLDESTPSQTAWALLGLMSRNGSGSQILNGIEYLMNSQQKDGSWDEKHYTGGGFPGTFYLKYELYKDYFPLLTLGKFKDIRKE